jgi:hypothetical protein
MNYTTTTNGAKQYTSSNDVCVDLFSKIGSMRHWDRRDILEYFEKAFEHNPELATRITYWARAARAGSGERKTFYTILDEIARISPNFISDNARTLAEIGYWKDLIGYCDIPGVLSAFARAIKDGDRLANKWAPRKGDIARKLRDELGYTNKEYRKWLKKHSDTVETKMSNNKWDDIKYSSVPGSAMRRYSRAYNRNDSQRFEDWKGDETTKASVSATYPHQIFGVMDHDEKLAEKMWRDLPDFIETEEIILPMIDVSGSMYGNALQVAISLGMYLAQRNKSQFVNTFLTFSENPQFVRIPSNPGVTLAEKFQTINSSEWGMNTNFEKAYTKILDLATKHNVGYYSMPTMLLCLSDMQFDESGNGSLHLEDIKYKYKTHGYEMPKLVFWDLEAHTGQHAQCSDENVAMISGFSPAIMKAVLNAEEFNPIDVMLEALEPIKLDYTNLKPELEIDYNREI